MSSIQVNLGFQPKLAEPVKVEETVILGNMTVFSETVGDIAYLQEKTIIPLDSRNIDPFIALRLNPEDEKNIRGLITDLDNKNYLQLLFSKKEMDRKGDGIKVVHPMRFIGYILQTPELRQHLKSIMRDSVKGSQFMNNFVNRMGEFAAEEDLQVYAEGFAQIVGVPLEIVKSIISSGEYSNFINKFI